MNDDHYISLKWLIYNISMTAHLDYAHILYDRPNDANFINTIESIIPLQVLLGLIEEHLWNTFTRSWD